MIIASIDPGNTFSAYCVYCSTDKRILASDKVENYNLLEKVKDRSNPFTPCEVLIVETVRNMGMRVGREVFDTCIWIGRFVQAWNGRFFLIPRTEVKLHMCGATRAKDKDIRAALVRKIGDKGTKKNPGPLYGFHADMYSALAIAVTYAEKNEGVQAPQAP